MTSTRSARGPSVRRPPSFTRATLSTPLFVLNLKAYVACLGRGADRFGRLLQEEGRTRGVSVAIAPSAPDLGRLSHRLSIPVLAQHVDLAEAGARTGHVVPEGIRAVGARGSLLNHSERPLAPSVVGALVQRLSSLDLVALVCSRDVADARRLSRYSPPLLAVEPPELIGGHRSVSTARPEVVAGAVDAVHQASPSTQVLCGAGIHSTRDVRRAIELGSAGVLVASAVDLSARPRTALRQLLDGF